MTKVEFARKIIEEVRYAAIGYARKIDQDDFAEANYLRGKIAGLIVSAAYHNIILDIDLDSYGGRFISFRYHYGYRGDVHSGDFVIDTLEYITRHLVPFNLEEQPEQYWTEIISLMDDTKREKVSFNESPCTREHFLREYCKIDRSFEKILKDEFGISL